jgi:hypothetical protein
VWSSTDPEVGKRVEFGHRIGVLEPHTEISSRFTLGVDGSNDLTMFAEENGYEKLAHPTPAPGHVRTIIIAFGLCTFCGSEV